MQIGTRTIGPNERPFIVAEVAQTHDGSLGSALAFIDVAKECGADAIKFQTHIAAEESTPAEPWRVRFSKQDATRFDYWKRMEFTQAQWGELKAHADAVGITFMSSPFSVTACEWLRDLHMPVWKVASGEVHNKQLLDWIVQTGDPVILSSGLSLTDETRALVHRLRAQGVPLALLHCTTRYPTPPEQVGLNMLEAFHDEFSDVPVGLSDHSGTIYPGVIASYLGASIIEVHLTLHRRMFGPDVSSSLTPEQLAELVIASDAAWRMRRHPVDKAVQLSGLAKERNIFGRSLVAAHPIAEGQLINEAALAFKKPGGGLTYDQRHQLLGKRARRDLPQDQTIGADDVV